MDTSVAESEVELVAPLAYAPQKDPHQEYHPEVLSAYASRRLVVAWCQVEVNPLEQWIPFPHP